MKQSGGAVVVSGTVPLLDARRVEDLSLYESMIPSFLESDRSFLKSIPAQSLN